MMRGYKELTKRGTNYLCGYADALTDITREIAQNNPDLYDCETITLIAFINEYISGLLKDQEADK